MVFKRNSQVVALADFGHCLKYGAEGEKDFKYLRSLLLNKRSESFERKEGINCVKR